MSGRTQRVARRTIFVCIRITIGCAGELFLNPIDQLLHAGWLGNAWISIQCPIPFLRRFPAAYRAQENDGRRLKACVSPYAGRHFVADHSRHDDVQEHEVRAKLPGGAERIIRPVFNANFVLGPLFEVQFEEAGETNLIIHDQNAFLFHDNSCSALRVMVARAPPRAPAHNWIVPPCKSTICLLTGKPSPVPMPLGLVVKNGSNTRASFSAGMPVPVSSTSTTTTGSPALNFANPLSVAPCPSNCAWRVRRKRIPPFGIAWIAFINKLMNTCSIFALSTRTIGTFCARSRCTSTRLRIKS